MTYSHGRRFEPTLEEELGGLLRAAKLEDRQARAVAARLGWDGKGSARSPSQPRARGTRANGCASSRNASAPTRATRSTACRSTRTALRLVEELAPIPTEQIGVYLARAGVSRRPFDVSGLLSAAEILGLDHHVVETGGMLRFGEQAA